MLIEQIQKNIHIPTYFTDMFKFNKEQNLLVSNISKFKNKNFFSPIYKNDMTTVGFKIKSTKTGKEKIFYLTKTQKENNNITYWIFTEENSGKLKVKINNF